MRDNKWKRICEEQKRIAERKLGRTFECSFVLDTTPDAYPEPRNFARTDGYVVWFSPKILRASPQRIKGLARHEIAHVLLMQEDITHCEQDADDLAEHIFRAPIYYDGMGVQTISRGSRPRPAHLPEDCG